MMSKTSFTFVTFSVAFIALLVCSQNAHADEPWENAHKSLPVDGEPSNHFGSSVAISGDLAIVGVPDDDEYGPHSGSVYLIEVSTGRQIFKLNVTDQSAYDYFGSAVAIDGSIAVIGAPFHRNRKNSTGAAYVIDLTTSQLISILRPVNGNDNGGFGSSVAIHGNRALIGAPDQNNEGIESGAAYIFNINTGRQLHKLQAPDGSDGDSFGTAVALNGKVAIIGADNDDTINGPSSGSAYLFNVTTGRFISLLVPEDGESRDQFGFAVGVSANLAIIGARFDDDNGTGSGSAYVFDITTGRQITKLLATDGRAGDSFGISVAIHGNHALVGATGTDDNGYTSGSAYIFETTTGRQLQKLLAPDGTVSDRFGLSVALGRNNAVIGATGDTNENGQSSGSAYFFRNQTSDYLLSVTPDPLVAGQEGIFTISKTFPYEKTWLIYSRIGLQQRFIRKLNIVIDLANPKLVARPKYTDEVGDLQFIVKMPRKRKWRNIWFQAVQRENTTNYIATQIVP